MNRQRIVGLLIFVVLILFSLSLPWVLTKTSTEATEMSDDGEERIGVVEPLDVAISNRMSWSLLISGGAAFAGALYLGVKGSSTSQPQGSSQSSHGRSTDLFLMGGITLGAYVLIFLRHFPLQHFYNFLRVTLGWITHRDPVAAMGISISILTLFLLYYLAYRLCRGQNGKRLWAVVLFGALAFAIVNFFVYPLTSTDVFDYVARGRITGVYEENPYAQVPNDYPDDPMVQLAAWRERGTAYGPLWEVLGGLIGRFAGDSLWGNVLGYKGLGLFGYLFSTILVALILRRVSPGDALLGTVLFAWNPLVLLEGVANLHNDMLMIALMLGGIWALSFVGRGSLPGTPTLEVGQNFAFALLCMALLGMSILIKFIPVLLLPLFLLYLLSAVEGGRRKARVGLVLLLPIMLISLYYFRTFWQWPQITNALIRRFEMFRMSLSSVTKEMLQVFIPAGVAQFLATWPYLLVFVLGYAIVLVRTGFTLGLFSPARWENSDAFQSKLLKTVRHATLGSGPPAKTPPWQVLMRACFQVLLLYLLFGNPWFWPWYLIWPIALLALYRGERMVVLLTIVACAAQLSHVLWNFVWYWLGTSWGNLHLVDVLAVGLMLVPALLVYATSQRKTRSFRR
jgi:hypothetical protein